MGDLESLAEVNVPILGRRSQQTLEYDWDPSKTVLVHNRSKHNILLNLPTGHFRLDAGRSFRMTPDIVELAQVRELIDSGQIEIGQ